MSSTTKDLTIRLYRVLQRACKGISMNNEQGGRILLQPALEATHWGRHQMFYNQPDSQSVEDIYRMFHAWNDDLKLGQWYNRLSGNDGSSPSLIPSSEETAWTTAEDLRQAIKIAFRTDYGVDSKTMHEWAIRAIQLVDEQQRMWSHSSSATTEQVRVTATSRCIGTSSPTSHFPPAVSPSLEIKHRFAYRIRIENLSDEDHVQLLGRYWCIEEEEEEGGSEQSVEPVIVDAPRTGAVGQLPVLRPGQVFEYMSGADLASTKGLMSGHFYMARTSESALSAKSGDSVDLEDSEKFEAIVAPFPLIA